MPEEEELEEEEEEKYPLEGLPEETIEDIFQREESYKIVKETLRDEKVEKRMKNFPLWAVDTKTLKLTFFDEADVRALENLFEAEVCRYLRSLPPDKQNLKTYMELGQARIIFMANIRRSLGTVVPKLNERTAILNMWRVIHTFMPEEKESAGIFSRLRGK